MTKETIQLSNGRQAEAIHAPRATPAKEIIEALRLPAPRGLVCLNGGTAKLDEQLQERLKSMLVDGLARVVGEVEVE